MTRNKESKKKPNVSEGTPDGECESLSMETLESQIPSGKDDG